jgi:L-rhamnose-H+ transport protein
MNYLLGLILVFAAGLRTGTVAWPMKLIRRLEFEHYCLVGMCIGLICLPWLVVLTQVPDPWRALAEAGWRPLLISNLCAVGWGAANVLYGVCVVRIGTALTGALLSGAGAMVAITMPMVFKGSGRFGAAPDLLSATGIGILCGLIVMILGVAVTAIAGFGRDKLRGQSDAGAGHGFLSGLIMTLVAGVLSAGLSLAFVYGQSPLMKAFLAQGVSESVANIGVWAATFFGGALVNVLYPVFVISRKKTWRAFASARIGYLYRQGGCWSLAIRNFHVNPSGNYRDVPQQKDGGAGFAVELVNVNSALRSFAEAEYHSTASESAEEVQGCRDLSQVRAFRGQESAIKLAARLLLGANPGRRTQNHED